MKSEGEFDPWATSSHGSKPASPEEIAFWELFEEYIVSRYGYRWLREIDARLDPGYRRCLDLLQKIARAREAERTAAAIAVWTEEET